MQLDTKKETEHKRPVDFCVQLLFLCPIAKKSIKHLAYYPADGIQGADADESMADLSASHHLSIYADTCSLRVDTSYSICKMGSPWRKESQEL